MGVFCRTIINAFNSEMKLLFQVHQRLAANGDVEEMRRPVRADADDETGRSGADDFGRAKGLLKF